MTLLKTTFIGYGLLFIFTAHNEPVQKKEAVVLQGKVIAYTDGKPVSNAHVFVIDGEEETMTNANGEFSIRSWQKAPFRITVEKHGQYLKESIVVADASRKQTIRMRDKP
jgi:hypothetical protein